MATRRDLIKSKRKATSRTAIIAARDDAREAVGDTDPNELQAAAAADGATFVAESDRARAHVRGAASKRRAGNVEIPDSAGAVVVGAPISLLVGRDRYAAAFIVVEAAYVVTSHDPHTFAPRPEYPAGVQERDYRGDLYERRKVIDNAARLIPDFLVNNNPDSVNGPPVCGVAVVDMVPRLVVLGGNSRAMSLALAYEAGRADGYRALVAERAPIFGLKPTDLDNFTAPVLVRVADLPSTVDVSRSLNEAQTLEKSATVDAVSASNRVSPRALDILRDSVDPDETVDAFLSSPAARSFVAALVESRAITTAEAPRYLSGRDLTPDGVDHVRRILIARVIPDVTTIDRMSKAAGEAVARSLPALLQGQVYGHDLAPDLRAALEDLADAAARKVRPEDLDAQGSLLGETTARAATPSARTLRRLLQRPAAFVRVLRLFGSLAQQSPAGQAVMFPEDARTTADILDTATTVIEKKEATT